MKFLNITHLKNKIIIAILLAEIQIKIVEPLKSLTVIKENTATFIVHTNYDNIPYNWYKSKLLVLSYRFVCNSKAKLLIFILI